MAAADITAHNNAAQAAPAPPPQRINAPLRLPAQAYMLPSLPKLVPEYILAPPPGSFNVNPAASRAPFPLHQAPVPYYYPVRVAHPVGQVHGPGLRQGLRPVDWGRASGRVPQVKKAAEVNEEAWVPTITSDYTRYWETDVYKEESKYYGREVDKEDKEIELELGRGATEPPLSPAVTEYAASNVDVDDLDLEFKDDSTVANQSPPPTPPHQGPTARVQDVEVVRPAIGQVPPPPPPPPAPGPPQQGPSVSNNRLRAPTTPDGVRIPRGVNIKIAAYAKHIYPYAVAKSKADAIIACIRENRSRPCSYGDATCSGGKLHCPGNPGESCERKYLNKHKLIQHLVDTRSWCPDCHTQLSRSDKKSLETHRQSTGCIAALYRDGPALDRPLDGSNKPALTNQPLRGQ